MQIVLCVRIRANPTGQGDCFLSSEQNSRFCHTFERAASRCSCLLDSNSKSRLAFMSSSSARIAALQPTRLARQHTRLGCFAAMVAVQILLTCGDCLLEVNPTLALRFVEHLHLQTDERLDKDSAL